jgi:hypothetical protein
MFIPREEIANIFEVCLTEHAAIELKSEMASR